MAAPEPRRNRSLRRAAEEAFSWFPGVPVFGIIRLVLRDQRTPLVIGIGCGLVASWWAVRLVEPYLYGLTAGDLGIWACAVVWWSW